MSQVIDDGRKEVGAMFTASGYEARHTSWILRMDHVSEPAPPTVPTGIEIRPVRPDDRPGVEHAARALPAQPRRPVLHMAMFEAAFSEFADRLPASEATWRAMTVGREGFAPEDLIVAVDGTQVVGGALLLDSEEIWVDKLAVAATHRHRGIGRGLLQTAFERSFDRGYDHTSLSTDSRTGALSLYERIGMHVTRSFTNWALDL